MGKDHDQLVLDALDLRTEEKPAAYLLMLAYGNSLPQLAVYLLMLAYGNSLPQPAMEQQCQVYSQGETLP